MKRLSRRKVLKAGAVAAGAVTLPMPFLRGLEAQARKETLVAISENGPNSLDIMGVGANRPAYEASWNIHDRLMSYGVKKDPNGNDHYDYAKLTPELAESWDVKPNSVTFKLRRDAKFHDGTPVTAKDVKWSFDRAVTVGGFPTFQMKAGSLEKPEQFVAVDDHTFRVDFLRADKLTLPDLAVVVPAVINSGAAKKHGTEKDPWAMDWYKTNHASGGAYKVTRFTPGTEIVYERNEAWKLGPLPAIKRVVWRIVPSSGNRRALLERGDADICLDMASKDFAEMAQAGKLKVIGTPVENALQYIGMNVNKPPFDKVKVRQAVAYAIPYERIMAQAVFNRALPMFGGGEMTTAWPQKSPFKTDLAMAKKLLAEAGVTGAIETTFSFDLGLGGVNEPIAILVQESLAQIGIKTTIAKVPGANWRGELLKKEMPLITNTFGGWLNYPEYFFFWCYHGQNAVFNTMSYKNPEMDRLIEAARFETDAAKYAAHVKGFVKLAWDDVPRIPLYQPFLDVAMQPNIGGYRYWFHRQLDYRQLTKA